jgi:hypothetical protein
MLRLVYRCALWFCPAGYRREHAAEMEAPFRG